MSLIKKNPQEAPAAPTAAPATPRSGKIFRDHRIREELPPAPTPEPGGEFQDSPLAPARVTPGTRVLGGGSGPPRPATTGGRTLPTLPTVTLDQHGQLVKPAVVEVVVERPAQDHAEGEEPPPPQPVGPSPDQILLEQAQMQAQGMLQEAQNVAQQMLMQAQEQAKQMVEHTAAQIQQAAEQAQQQAREQGYELGYTEGKSQGAVHAQIEVRQLMVQSRDVFMQAIRQRHLMLASCEPQLARLGTKIAERILGLELTTNREAIVGIVKQALAGLGDRETVSVRVNPQDFDQAKANQPMFERMVEGLKKFEVVADLAIDAGGCSIETNLGNVDARLNTQLATLLNAVEEESDRHQAEVIEESRFMQVDLPPLPEEEPVPEPVYEEAAAPIYEETEPISNPYESAEPEPEQEQ